ncbi:hypothetical protein EXIGLDRAFT_727477, partial [Exidia glandulosa HHB12029]
PGQLDPHQIEAQIGNGFIEVKDVQLDEDAINEFLSDLPVRLVAGTLGTVTARVPWPNILSATFALAVSGVRLKFSTAPPRAPRRHARDITEAVTQVAEEFVHEELTPEENSELRKSIIFDPNDDSDDDDNFHPPGSIDPWLKPKELDEAQDAEAAIEGVSVLASVVDRILTRFSVNAKDISVSLVQEGVAELTLSLADVSFGVDQQDAERTDDKRVHTLRVSGVSLSLGDLTPPPPPPLPSSSSSSSSSGSLRSSFTVSEPPAPTSGLGLAYDPPTIDSPFDDDDSDVDDAAMMAMSQSIAALPPRGRTYSHSTAATASVYHSAAGSVMGDDSDEEDEFHDARERFSHFLEPSSHSIYRPPPAPPLAPAPAAAPVQPPIPTLPPPSSPLPNEPVEKPPHTLVTLGADPLVVTVTTSRATGLAHLALDVKLGVIAGSIGAQHLRALLKLADALPPAPSKPSSRGGSTPPSTAPEFDIQAHIRGAVFLVLLEDTSALDDFYRRPLSAVPSCAHIRVHLDALDASLHTVSSLGLAASSASVTLPPKGGKRVLKVSLADLSLFTYSSSDGGYAPLVITDSHLPTQYAASATFPSFDVADWTLAASKTPHPRLAQWRAKPGPATGARRVAAPAASLHLEGQLADVEIAPLRVFLDLRTLESVLAFSKALDLVKSDARESDDSDEEDTPPATPRASDARRLLEDLDAQTAQQELGLQSVLRCAGVRVEVRVPTARSGALVLDVHDIRMNSGPGAVEPERHGVSFAPEGNAAAVTGRGSKFKVVAKAEWSRIVIAYAGVGDTRATSFLSIHSQPESDAPAAGSSLIIRRSSLEVALPSAHGLLSKPVVDGLQYWADDAAQWAERTFSNDRSPPSSAMGSDVLGSRYFEGRAESLASSSAGSGAGLEKEKTKASGMVVRVTLLEANVQMFMPRANADGAIRPLSLKLSELDLLLEAKPEGKNETLITVSLMDIRVSDAGTDGEATHILGLTSERTFSSPTYPLVKLRFASSTDASTGAKEARIKATLYGFTYTLSSDFAWALDVAAFVKNPPGTFEVVVPTERTRINVKIVDGSVHIVSPPHRGAIALALTEMELATELLGDSPDVALSLSVGELAVLAIDDVTVDVPDELLEEDRHLSGQETWRSRGYAVLVEVTDFGSQIMKRAAYPKLSVDVNSVKLSLHACADTINAVAGFGAAFAKAVSPPDDPSDAAPAPKPPNVHSLHRRARRGDDIMASVDDNAFRRLPAVGSAPDLIDDDLPRNMNYVDVAYGTAAGLVALSDDGEDDEDGSYLVRQPPPATAPGIVSEYGGETIRILDPIGINIIDDYFENLPPDLDELAAGDQELRVRVSHCDVTVLLYDGYDWVGTRRAIDDEMRRIRRRLEKIRQLLADGQAPDESIEDTSALLFNSVHLGLHESPDELDPATLLVAINEELGEDDAASVSSWQSLTPMDPAARGKRAQHTAGQQRKSPRRLRRSAKPLIEIRLSGIALEHDKLAPDCPVASRILAEVRDLEILDHIKTSTWRKFLTGKRTDSQGNVRETGSSMARVELVMVRPVPGLPSEEARLKAKILPLRLHVDQDALDFLKKFAAFRDPRTAPPPPPTGPSSNDIFFQHAEIFPVDLKLDYKPKRVDFQALRDGKTIELMNFFHFDGAEMTLRHITLSGLTGWPRLFDTLNDLWTPDVKANQLADIISGVAPIRSIVNVGSGVADLVLLPIAQYKKDKRLFRGMQKGATSFVKSTAMEAIRLGAQLATGTQVILEHAEGVFGGRAPEGTLEISVPSQDADESGESRYAQQPGNVSEGIRGAARSLRTNLNSAAQTILAVPMEVHESREGTLHTVVRAVPIAVLRPMIGASEAVSKTLFGLRNTLDPGVMAENEAKYKRRER